MSEPEIDALMAGQEDENGSVHYEGKCMLFFHKSPLFIHFLLFCLLFHEVKKSIVRNINTEFLHFFCFIQESWPNILDLSVIY